MHYTIYTDVSARKRLKLIIDEIRDFTGNGKANQVKILDIGCGLGGMTFPLSSLGYQVVGVDLDSDSIKSCNEKNKFPNAKYLTEKGEQFNLHEKFDIVICSEVLEHSLHPELILQTIRNHLKINGIGIVTVPNGYCFYEIMFSRFFQRIGLLSYFHRLPSKSYTTLTGSPSPYHSMNVFCNHVQFFTFNRFKELLNSCDFTVSTVYNVNLGLFLDWKWLETFRRIECRLADYVSPEFAGGWVAVIKHKNHTREG